MAFLRGLIVRAGTSAVAKRMGKEIIKRAPSMLYSGVVGSVAGVAATASTIVTSDEKAAKKIEKLKHDVPRAAVYGGAAGLLFAAGIKKYPIATVSTAGTAGYSGLSDLLDGMLPPSVKMK